MQSNDLEADVAVIGAGIAGALIAWRLASAGARVVIIDSGPVVDRAKGIAQALSRSPTGIPEAASPVVEWAPKPSTLDPHSYFVQTGPDLFKSGYERQVGGTTWHWLGTAIRLLPSDFRLKSEYGVGIDWPISYDEIEPWYLEAEQVIGVAGSDEEDNGAPRSGPYPMAAIPLTYSDAQFQKAVQSLGLVVTATPQARISAGEGYNGRPQCCGNAFCIPMCPIGAKYDAMVHLDLAEKAGATIIADAIAHTIDIDEQGLVSGIVFRHPDRSEQRLTAKQYVVAAHAIETPKLLLLSRNDRIPNGVANASDQVGRNLMDHPTQLTYALASEPMGPYRAPLSTAGIEMLRDGGFRTDRGAFRIELGNDGWSWPGLDPVNWAQKLIKEGHRGKDLYDQIRELNVRAVRMAALVEQLPVAESRVTVSDQMDAIGIPRPEVHYVIDDYAKQGLLAAQEQLAGIFDALGVEEMTTVPDIQGAGHIMGTYRMGSDKSDSVTDSFGRSWDHPNLWLAGSGLFPTTGTANPTLTIAALALRTAPEILSELGRMGMPASPVASQTS